MRWGGGALLEAVWGPGQGKSVHEGVPVCEPLCTLMYARVHVHTHSHAHTFTYAHALTFMHTNALMHNQMRKLLDQNHCSGWHQATLEGSCPGAQYLLRPVSLKAFSQALGRETQLSLRREAGSQDDAIATSHGSMLGARSQD